MKVDSRQVDYDRIRILYSGMNRALVGGVILIIVLGLIINETLEIRLVIFWATATALSYVPRIFLARSLHKKITNKQVDLSNVLTWELYWILTTVPVLAAFTALLFFPITNVDLVFVAVILVILTSGSTMVYATSMKTIVVSYCVILVPTSIRFFMVGEPGYTILGYTFIACFVIFYSYASSLNKTLVENIKLKIENEDNSLKDPLTSLLNRRGLHVYLDKIIPQSLRNKEPFGIVLIDIDHFKKYNDTYGHSAGDDLLVKFSEMLQNEVRDGDLAVRYGGEEFILVVPKTNINELKEYTDRIFSVVKYDCKITISAGLAVHTKNLSFDQLFGLADEALYAAKGAGRDQYQVASVLKS